MNVMQYKTVNGRQIPSVSYPDQKYQLGEIGQIILKNMQENYSSCYWDLAMAGTLLELVYKRQEELKESELEIMEQLEEKNPRPQTDNTMEITRHLNSLHLEARELLMEEINLPI